jgi:uncharacterized protein (TIGR00269 family)
MISLKTKKVVLKNMKFIKEFEARVKKKAKKLLNKKEKILVACSGGKDSTTILYLLHKWGYDVEAIIIDLLMGEWFEKNVQNITKFCKDQGVRLHIVNVREALGGSMCYVRSCIQNKIKLNNCMICGVIKRYLLNKKARELGGAKIVTGHNRDDLVESVIMNLIMGSPRLCMGLGPRTGVIRNELFTQKIKPLNYIAESDIKKYSEIMGFPVVYEPCPCSHNAFRRDVKKLLNKYAMDQDNVVKFLKKIQPRIEKKYKINGELKKCSVCGEAARGETCKTCELINLI